MLVSKIFSAVPVITYKMIFPYPVTILAVLSTILNPASENPSGSHNNPVWLTNLAGSLKAAMITYHMGYKKISVSIPRKTAFPMSKIISPGERFVTINSSLP